MRYHRFWKLIISVTFRMENVRNGARHPRATVDREETESRYGNWREAQSKMAAAGWIMEPFIQLTYNDQCPLKTSQLTETSFVDKRKVTEHFWFDLLERKCPEGVFMMFVLVQLERCCIKTSCIDFLSLPLLENRNLIWCVVQKFKVKTVLNGYHLHAVGGIITSQESV